MAFDNIHLEKGMYHEAGRSFTQVLEQLDPSEGDRGTPLENTDAFQRQLKRFGIRVKGAGSPKMTRHAFEKPSACRFSHAARMRRSQNARSMVSPRSRETSRTVILERRLKKPVP